MGTTADKLNKILNTKAEIKSAIESKGIQNVGDVFSEYPSKIKEITYNSAVPGHLELSSVSSTFKVQNEIKSVVLPTNMDNVTDMINCFNNCTSLASLILPELPAVTNMRGCFYGCSSLTSLTLSGLSKVTDMMNCFNSCTSLTSLALPELPNVTNMMYCFNNCTSLASLTLSGLSKVTDMSNCFNSCRSLASLILPELPAVTNMSGCFYACSSLQNISISSIGNTITSLTNWGISSCYSLTKDSLVNILNALPTISDSRTCTIGTTNLSKLTAEEIQIGTDKGWTIN